MEEQKKDPADSNRTVFWMIITLGFISRNLKANDSSLYLRFIDNRFILELLQIIPELNEISFVSVSALLCRIIQCSFKSCGYGERGLHLKSAIFSWLPIFYDLTKKFRFEERLVANLLIAFSHYLLTEDWRYFKSDVKSLLDDGTAYKVVKLISDSSNADVHVGFYDKYICLVVDSFCRIFPCVKGTLYEDRFCRVEMRLINRLAIKKWATICRAPTRYTIKNVLLSLCKEIDFANPEDVKFYLDNKLYKKLVSKCASYFSRNLDDIDYLILYHLIIYLSRLGSASIFRDYIKLGDIRSLIQILPDLVNSKKHVDSSAPSGLFRSRLTLVLSILRSRLLKEEHFYELKQRNILLLGVENMKKFYDQQNMEIVQLSFTMLWLCMNPENFTCWLSLNEIDQVLPGIPLLLELFGRESACTFSHLGDVSEIISANICCSIISNLRKVKENWKDKCIGAQLDALEEYDFASTLGRALIRTEDKTTKGALLQTLLRSCKLFGNSKFMKSVSKILPDIADVQLRRSSEVRNLDITQVFCMWIMRKAAAYNVLNDCNPTFIRQIANQVFYGWLDFRILDGKIFFSPNKEESEEMPLIDESIIDILRATWWLIKKYPNLVNTGLPKCNPLLEPPSSDENIKCTDLTSSIIIETIKSYLDNSQEKCAEFLLELTSFVKDLSFDSMIRSPKMKILCEMLVSASERFIALDNSGVNAENLRFFIDANK